ncbi:MAG: TIGR03016 family PEP-CTERM system-associated outer membrane protein [Halioglobus sp.]|nr:TIGR03016 family PEP-CTERM system-associated outer membrane protein [Halioglobus sp.]
MKSGSAQRILRYMPCVVVGCALPASGFAAEFTTSAAVAPGVTYTDNVCLSNDNKRDAWVGTVTPSGSIKGQGNKASFNVNGSVQFNTLTDSQLKDNDCAGGSLGNRSQFSPNITAKGSAILIDDWLKLNASGRANQNEVTPFVGGGGDSFDTNGNTNTYYRYSLSPVLSRRLKDFATYNLRYNYNEVINTADSVSNSSSDSWSTNLESGSSSRVSWDLFGDYRKVSYDNSDLFYEEDGTAVPREDSELKSAGLNLGYRIDRRWQVTGTYGWEWNDFQTYNDEDTDGKTWDLGVNWTPTPRTKVSVGMGDRFFGKTPRFSISHRHKRNVFSASYRKSITFGRDILTEGNDFNQSVRNFSSQNSQSPIIDERFTLGYTYTGRRASINFIGSHSDQTQEDNGEKSTYDDIALTFSPLISRTYTMSATVSWRQDEPRSIFGQNSTQLANNSEAWTTSLTVGRELNERMNISLNYRYTDQQSDNQFSEYQENRIMATLNIRL